MAQRHPRLAALIAIMIIGFVSGGSAQQKPPAQVPTAPQEPDAVVRITTQLVQIDVVVTDSKGAHVDDLTADDFELLVDGKPQTLSHFSLVKLSEAARSAAASAPPRTALPTPGGPPAPPLAPEQVKRTIAFVVDDLGLSFASTAYARRAIKKFVEEQMQEGDLVGIIRTGRGLGALQQFTSDRRVLLAAAEKLTWNPISRDMLPRFGAPEGPAGANQEARLAQERFDDFRETVFSVGTLGALNFVVRGLRELPGRKMAILISDGFRLFGRDRDNTQVLDRVRRLVDLANRSSVVVYSLDARGLQTLMPSAADNLSGVSPQQLAEQLSRASREQFESQDGLVYLARETGGFAVLNNNDLSSGVQRIVRDNQSYYLLGFDPEERQFDRRFHALKVRVKRPGLRVRTRAGFFGVPEPEARPQPKTRDEQILHALYSPFGARDLPLQMTSLFFNSEQGDSFVRSLFHIDCSRLTFKEAGDGLKVLQLELVAFTFNEQGQITDQHGRAFTLNFDEAHYRIALARGLVYAADFLIKKPGAYQFRAVLRDPASERLGSAGQFIQVPDLAKDRLALSGLVLDAEPVADGSTAGAAAEDPQPTSAVRRFARHGELDYGAAIYNAATDKQSGEPRLTTQVEVYRDGQSVFQAAPRPVEIQKGSNPKRVGCTGRLKLGGLPPGDYLLHLIVTDALANPKYARAEQWMDFSVR